MVLTGRLSNHELTTLIQRLTTHDWKQADFRRPSASGVAPDGRRKFGTVRDAIVTVLEQAGSDLRVRDIHPSGLLAPGIEGRRVGSADLHGQTEDSE